MISEPAIKADSLLKHDISSKELEKFTEFFFILNNFLRKLGRSRSRSKNKNRWK
jgi:hypothetical protein